MKFYKQPLNSKSIPHKKYLKSLQKSNLSFFFFDDISEILGRPSATLARHDPQVTYDQNRLVCTCLAVS